MSSPRKKWRWIRPVARVAVPIGLAAFSLLLLNRTIFYWWTFDSPPGPNSAAWRAAGNWSCGEALGCWVLAGAVVYWLRPRRFPPGACEQCGYDLTGLAAGAVCPECGGGR